jgi:hypothetical protein
VREFKQANLIPPSLGDWPDLGPNHHVEDRVDREEHRYYRTPDGVFPGVTTVLKVLGLSREGLINWAVNLEREACLAAAAYAYLETCADSSVSAFDAAMKDGLGAERAHQRALTKAGDIGTQAHARVKWFLAQQCGQDPGPCPVISDQAARAYVSFTDWWAQAGLKPVRVEQPIWHAGLGYAGTGDLIADDSDGFRDIYDFKTGKGIYLEHHLQVRAYVEAAREWSPIRGGKLIRLPKTADDVFMPERDIETMGDWKYGKRTFSEDELMAAFRASLIAWNLLKRRPDFQGGVT